MRSQAEVEELRSKVSLKMRQELVSPETDVGGPLGTAVTRVTRNAQRLTLVAGTLDWVLGDIETEQFEQILEVTLEEL